MTEVRFHREIYASAALDEAIQVFTKYAALERAEETSHWVVKVTTKSPARERKVALELGNYALGLTRKDTVAS